MKIRRKFKSYIKQGDCLNLMQEIPDKSIDLILCDLPYGTSACKWDSIIPLDKLWEQYKRIIKDDRAIVLFSNQPFTSLLIMSNLNDYKYNWVWEKDNGTNFLNSHYCPLKVTEDICVFSTGAISYTKKGNFMPYNPQFTEGKPYTIVSGNHSEDISIVRGSVDVVNGYKTESDGKRYPKNLIRFNRDNEKLHPTQKPVALLEYLIKTYSNEGDIVLDNCMGSGSTLVACISTHRKYIGFEKEEKFFNVAKERLEQKMLRG